MKKKPVSKASASLKTRKPAVDSKQKLPPASPTPPPPFPLPLNHPPIVGLGASAGGLEALKTLFSHMPPDTGLAFVVAMHLNPDHKSAIRDLISRVTSLKTFDATPDALIEPNSIYVISPGTILTVKRGRLRVTHSSHQLRDYQVNRLFESLAADQGSRAAVVVLSGMGSDGTAGCQAVKHAGGFVVVQSPGSAQSVGMPESAIANDNPDWILAPERIPGALMAHFKQWTGRRDQGAAQQGAVGKPQEQDQNRPASLQQISPDEIDRVQKELYTRTGHDFSSYKRGTIMRRVQRRMAIRGIASTSDYALLVRHDANEATALFRDLLVGVTEFFREPDSWDVLRDLVVDPMIAERPPELPVRIWVPGCATGQEAYSIGMLLTERMEALERRCDVKIFATDINDAALEAARAGIFPEDTIAKLAPERLARFFTRGDAGGYQIIKPVRNMVVFAQQSLIADPPFSRLDLVSCRNVLIYLDPEVQRKVLTLFCHAIRPGGFLFLGNTESIGPFEDFLRPVSKKWRIFQRIGTSRRVGLSFPLAPLAEARRGPENLPARDASPARLATIAQRLVHEQFAPASVLVNQQGQVLYSCGPTHEYLTQPPGVPTADLVSMARGGLRVKLRGALQKTMRDSAPVTVSGIRLRQGGTNRMISIQISPVADAGEVAPMMLVVFEEQSMARRRRRETPEAGLEEDSLVRQLEHDLKATRDDLQSHLEEIETSNEELKAANEEMMSMNEKLQSANEELETSKEELQSLNEELTTLNNQLNSKVEELEATNNDLENLLASTDLATIFLDRSFNIRRFTPAIRQLVSLLPSDVGRPITDFAQRVSDESLLADAQQVLDTLVPIQTEVRSEEGRVYVRRILPYRTEEDYIDGVVITFNNISDRKIAEQQQAHLAAIVASSEDAILSKDLSGKILTWNDAAERLFGYTAAEMIGKPIATIIPPDRLAEEMRILETVRHQESMHIETARLTKSGETIPISLSISPVLGADGEVMAASSIARDISDRRAADQHQQMLVAELDHRVKNTLAVVLSLASQTLQRSEDLKEFGPAFEGRIFALAQAHTLLSRGKWKGGSLRGLIEQVVLAVEGNHERCVFEGGDVIVPPRVAIALAIVFNELTTNAMKHGALQNGGNVMIDWEHRREEETTTLEFRWAETGGDPVTPPETFGYGSQLISMCVKHDLGGEIEMDYKPDGVQCRLRVKWAEGWGGF